MSQGTISVFEGAGKPFSFQSVELPVGQLGANEALVEIQKATICGSDIWTYTGARPSEVPMTLGHEGVGVIVESNRRDLVPGQRVVWSIVDSCGRCPYCTDFDLPQKCDRLLKYGHTVGSFAGTYATHMLLRAGTTVLPVPPNMHEAVACTLCCAWSSAQACLEELPTEARRVLVVGMGMLGVAAAFLAQRNGREVYVTDSRDAKLDLAREIGFLTETPAEVDAVIEAAGSVEAFESALTHLRMGGTAVIAGLVHPDTHLSMAAEAVVRNCWTWVGVHNYQPRHLHRAIVSAHAFQDRIDVSRVFSQAYGLHELGAAMQDAQSGQWLRVVVDPHKV